MLFALFYLASIMFYGVFTKPTGNHIEPCTNPLECLHGVLMHGDKNTGDSHETEDKYLKFKPVLDTGPKKKSGPNDAEKTFHGALMHGGEEHDGEHIVKNSNQPTKKEILGPKDTNTMIHDVMHGDTDKSHDHKHSTGTQSKQEISPPDAEKLMHDVLMHSENKTENHHVHSRPEDESNMVKGPMDQNNLMHNLMHDGEHVDHSKEEQNKNRKSSGPNSDALHGVLMHGDSEQGKDHKHDHSNSENVPFKFDIEEIKKLGIDPEILKTILPDDKEDFKNWQKEKDSDDNYLDTSYASISDSILSDIEVMKQRYLEQNPVIEAEVNAYVEAKDSDFVADKLVAVLDNAEHDDDDMLHDLELIGSTDPIKEIHRKFHGKNTKSRQREEI